MAEGAPATSMLDDVSDDDLMELEEDEDEETPIPACFSASLSQQPDGTMTLSDVEHNIGIFHSRLNARFQGQVIPMYTAHCLHTVQNIEAIAEPLTTMLGSYKRVKEVVDVQHALDAIERDNETGDAPVDTDLSALHRSLDAYSEFVFWSSSLVYCESQLVHMGLGTSRNAPPSIPHLLNFRWRAANEDEMADSDQNACEKVINFMVKHIYNNGLRRKEGDKTGELYSQVYVNRIGTHAWQKRNTMEREVYEAADRHLFPTEWRTVSTNRGAVMNAVKYLENCRDTEVMRFKVGRSAWSFLGRDGNPVIYDGTLDRVFEANEYPRDQSVARHFDREFQFYPEFREDAGSQSVEHGSWFNIPTPSIDKFLDVQQLDESVKRWIWVFFGRCFYDVGDYDNWQVVLFPLGKGGTGKSTLLKCIAHAYEPQDVGIMSNRMEKQFGLSAFFDKCLVIAPEIGQGMSLSQQEFQSIVSGEPMSVAVKRETACNLERWKVPVLLAGNELPVADSSSGTGWQDKFGSIARRVLVVPFKKTVSDSAHDNQLEEKVFQEFGNVILKANRAYRAALEVVGTNSIWQHLPPIFHENRRMVSETTNPLMSFLASSTCSFGEEKCVPQTVFLEFFKKFCRQTGKPPPPWNEYTHAGPFEDKGIVLEVVPRDCKRLYGGRMRYGVFFRGVDCAETEEEQTQ